MIILTSCTARKLDDIPIPPGALTIQPLDYLDNAELIEKLNQTRKQIFDDPRTKIGVKSTYAFDLYVNSGNAYKDLKRNHYQQIKSLLLSRKLDWYFLSGGYGIIHALEPAKKYQATFSRGISYQKKIPYTTKHWKELLPEIIETIVSKENPEHFYTFGSQDYTRFVKITNIWDTLNKHKTGYKMFESTGSAGPHWISKILAKLANHIEKDDPASFGENYPEFTKQK